MRRLLPLSWSQLAWSLVALTTALIVVRFGFILQRDNSAQIATFRLARHAFDHRDFSSALSICVQLIHDHGESPELLLMAGESASRLEQFQESIQYYDRIPDSAGRDAAVARWAKGEVLLHLKQMSGAIAALERCLALDPRHDAARDRLVYLLNLSGRRRDAIPHLLDLVARDRWQIQHLLYLGNSEKSIENERELSDFLTTTPNDALPNLGLARIRIRGGAHRDAIQLLSTVMASHSELAEVHAQLGKALLYERPEELERWNQSLPSSAELHPDIWLLRGEWAQSIGSTEVAARCFSEALLRDPDHQASLNALVPVLNKLGHAEKTSPISLRAAKVEQLVAALEHVMSNEWSKRRAISQHQSTVEHQSAEADIARFVRSEDHLRPIFTAAQVTLELGRQPETAAWIRFGQSFAPQDPRFKELAIQANSISEWNAGRTLTQLQVIDAKWIQSLQLSDWKVPISNLKNRPQSLPPSVPGVVRFEEVPGALNFSYFASRDSFSDGRRMFEVTGGGVGVLDYDRDGWPDLFLPQGCHWPVDGTDDQHSDCLQRNQLTAVGDGDPFLDVSRSAFIVERAFGQGVAIGDVNSDGFDDVYVCNVGANQLWLNQGDGTFGDGSSFIQPNLNTWTTTAAIADLNQDGVAEIYDANYVEGEDVFDRRCVIGGLPRACGPLNFQPTKGRLLAANDVGVFCDISEQTMPPALRDGNALGVVVLRTKGDELPSIFVANDQVANLMLRPLVDAKSPFRVRYEDQAALLGLAFDAEGKAQACMGVAAGDANGDGTIDLFVTNYHDEPNTLYLQENGLFRDSSRGVQLVGPSLKMLGFGTQWIDVQLDGRMDLLVLNGHIDDMSHLAIPYRMRAQFLEQTENARFVERSASDIGTYFADQRLGRALALLDYNRDGKQDFVATELDGPTQLVRNLSPGGNFLAISLVGTTSHRDAIGTEVQVTVSGTSWTQQLTAGNGYMVCNQKCLVFGLGSAKQVDRIDIHWPNGLQQTYRGIGVDTHWIALENRPDLIQMF